MIRRAAWTAFSASRRSTDGGLTWEPEILFIARFNLAWLLQGEPTGDGTIPDWVR
jgi:hypothetical protein